MNEFMKRNSSTMISKIKKCKPKSEQEMRAEINSAQIMEMRAEINSAQIMLLDLSVDLFDLAEICSYDSWISMKLNDMHDRIQNVIEKLNKI